MAKSKQPEPQSLDDKSEGELKREAKARLRRLSPIAAAQVVEETVRDKARRPGAGFVAFIRERAVVGLAIGFVVGTQVQAVVKQLIASFVDPLFQLALPNNKTLTDQTWYIHIGDRHADFGWGALVYALLDFLVIIFVIYLVIHLFKLDRLDKKQ